LVERFGHEVEEAIDDLRAVASGIYPTVLTDHGVVAALRSVAQHAAIPVAVEANGIARHEARVESTVYFCCVEAVQNAAKHAGAGASVTIWLDETGGEVRFGVEDNGRGFDHTTAPKGRGLTNIADRLATVGGTLTIDTTQDAGTRITGGIPLPATP
jgi:signal transduction histidine kinase